MEKLIPKNLSLFEKIQSKHTNEFIHINFIHRRFLINLCF